MVPDEKAYNLTAYYADTGKQVFYWSQVAPNHQFVAGDVIDHDGDQWMVIGVRGDSTAEERRVDVRLATFRRKSEAARARWMLTGDPEVGVRMLGLRLSEKVIKHFQNILF